MFRSFLCKKPVKFVPKMHKIRRILNESFERSLKLDSNNSQIFQKFGFDSNHRVRFMILTQHYFRYEIFKTNKSK